MISGGRDAWKDGKERKEEVCKRKEIGQDPMGRLRVRCWGIRGEAKVLGFFSAPPSTKPKPS